MDDSAAATVVSTLHLPRLGVELELVRPLPAEVLKRSNGPGSRAGSDAEDSTGLLRWHQSSHLLAGFVAVHAELVRGKRVLELGCGAVPSVGLAAAAGGAAHVDLTDCSTDALHFARRNAERNAPALQAAVGVRELDWQAPMPLRAATSGVYEAAVEQCYDVVMGSELMYHWTDLQALARTVRRHLTPGGVFLCVNHFRVWDQYRAWVEAARAQGLVCYELHPEDVADDLGDEVIADLGIFPKPSRASGDRFVVMLRPAGATTGGDSWSDQDVSEKADLPWLGGLRGALKCVHLDRDDAEEVERILFAGDDVDDLLAIGGFSDDED